VRPEGKTDLGMRSDGKKALSMKIERKKVLGMRPEWKVRGSKIERRGITSRIAIRKPERKYLRRRGPTSPTNTPSQTRL